ncbi:MAG: undecaprenyl-diphosphate phosphatase [Actinomycetota bacterium]
MTYFQAIVIGLLQGVTELFPVSSLGHSVLFPSLFGWHTLARAQSQPESFFLAFLVALHVATALALLTFFWRDWVRLITAFFRSIGKRSITTTDERLAWLLVVATIPAGITGLLLEHAFRVVFAKPLAAACFLILNGAILALGERLRRRQPVRQTATYSPDVEPGRQLETLEFKEAGVIGIAQIGALLAGISRSGITMVAGLVRGLNHEDAARFSFLLATPIILGAGLYKIPDLMGPLGNGVRGQALVGGVAAAIAAFVSVKFLMKYFETRTLTPFAIYCGVFGLAMVIRFA